MSIPTYTPGYPPDGSSLGQTKAVIRNNLDGTFQTLGVDHVNNNGQPGSNPAGYHTVAHMVPQATDPAAITGFGQLYSKTLTFNSTNDQALFWETGQGLIQQLTTNITPLAAQTGYTFLPGGIILQWGVTTSTGSSTPVLFPFTFPAAAFSAVATRHQNSSSDTSYGITSLVTTGFTFTANSSASGIIIFWFAIGN